MTDDYPVNPDANGARTSSSSVIDLQTVLAALGK
jgi:hypothetical protein